MGHPQEPMTPADRKDRIPASVLAQTIWHWQANPPSISVRFDNQSGQLRLKAMV